MENEKIAKEIASIIINGNGDLRAVKELVEKLVLPKEFHMYTSFGIETCVKMAMDNADEKESKLDLCDVSQQCELLLAFKEWYGKHTIAQPIHSKNIENFLKANNCG